jgi:hypothetical protein
MKKTPWLEGVFSFLGALTVLVGSARFAPIRAGMLRVGSRAHGCPRFSQQCLNPTVVDDPT